MDAGGELLSVRGLTIALRTGRAALRLVEDVTFDIGRGEIVGIVGESGSGKSLTALAILRALPPGVEQVEGSVRLDGRDLGSLGKRDLRDVRRHRLGAIFQDPQTSLNPAFTVGNQLVETIRNCHADLSSRAAQEEALTLLDRVGITDPRMRLRQYPHQLSGGIAQRVMVALAIAGRPALLVADEPTTALDVTVQAQILDLLVSLRDEQGLSVALISHDLGVVADVADRVVVFYAGQVVNTGATAQLLDHPSHPYTEALLRARPSQGRKGAPLRLIPGSVAQPGAMPTGCRFAARCAYAIERCVAAPVPLVTVEHGVGVRCVRQGEDLLAPAAGDGAPAGAPGVVAIPDGTPLLSVRGVTKRYGGRGGDRSREFSAVDDVTLDVAAGETLGIVGESGAGKSTVGRLILGLTEPTRGSILFAGAELAARATQRPRAVRRALQVVFQNPYATLDPLMTVGNTVAEPLDVLERLTTRERSRRVLHLLSQVGLDEACASRYPAELSGGQRQRVAIARAIAPAPALVVCDEPVSSLDVSTQAQVINLLEELQAETGVAYVFIGHDLAVVHHISDRIAVMYRGEVVELNDAAEIYTRPRHPYTRRLIDSLPGARVPQGSLPSDDRDTAGATDGNGCPYVTVCPVSVARCTSVEPPVVVTQPSGFVRCHLYADAGDGAVASAAGAAGVDTSIANP